MGLIDFVGDILGDVGGIVGDVIGVATGGFDPVSIAINTIGRELVGEIFEGTDEVIGIANAASSSSVVEVIRQIGEILREVRDALKPIVDSVAETVRKIADVVKDINETFIKPILGPIAETIRIIKDTLGLIERQWKAGIEGILQIPTTIANAVGSIDAAFQRAAAMLSAGLSAQIAAELRPGLENAGMVPLESLSRILRETLPDAAREWRPPREFSPDAALDVAAWEAEVKAFVQRLMADNSMVGRIAQWVWEMLLWAPLMLAKSRALITRALEFYWAEAGIERFDVGTTLDLYGKNVLTREAAFAELRRQGYNEERANALLEGVRRIPLDQQALDWWYRGLIDETGLRRILNVNNWTPEDADLVIQASRRLLTASEASEAYLRGMLSSSDVDRLLASYGYPPEFWPIIRSLAQRPTNTMDWIAYLERLDLFRPGMPIGAERLTVPDEIQRIGTAEGLSAEQVQALWALHWRILSPDLAIEAYFRGLFNEAQLTAHLDAAAIPRETQAYLIDLRRPLLPVRSIITLLNRGAINDAEALAMLRQHGYDDGTAAQVLALGKAAEPAEQPQEAQATGGLTLSLIMRLYRAGALDRPEARDLLLTAGVSEQAADAHLLISDIEQAAEDRAAAIDLIIAQVQAGLMEFEEAVAALGAVGATTEEQNRALTKLARTQRQKTKIPSEATILRMYRHGLINRAAAADALELHGYAEGWAELLIMLEERGGEPS